MTTQYQIVADSTINGLVNQVNQLLSQGWVCQGGVAMYFVIAPSGQSGGCYSQAMVK
jgi:hypothetical protein